MQPLGTFIGESSCLRIIAHAVSSTGGTSTACRFPQRTRRLLRGGSMRVPIACRHASMRELPQRPSLTSISSPKGLSRWQRQPWCLAAAAPSQRTNAISAAAAIPVACSNGGFHQLPQPSCCTGRQGAELSQWPVGAGDLQQQSTNPLRRRCPATSHGCEGVR